MFFLKFFKKASMKRKRKHTKKRSTHKGLSSPGHKRKRSRPRSKGLLADVFNPTIAMKSGQNTLVSVAGGLGAVIVDKNMIPAAWGKPGRMISGVVAGFLLSSFGMPVLGASLSGGMTALAFKGGLLADDMQETEFADEKALEEQALFLDEEGNTMVLNEDGSMRYLTEMEEELVNA